MREIANNSRKFHTVGELSRRLVEEEEQEFCKKSILDVKEESSLQYVL
jgi:hypothetical protein